MSPQRPHHKSVSLPCRKVLFEAITTSPPPLLQPWGLPAAHWPHWARSYLRPLHPIPLLSPQTSQRPTLSSADVPVCEACLVTLSRPLLLSFLQRLLTSHLLVLFNVLSAWVLLTVELTALRAAHTGGTQGILVDGEPVNEWCLPLPLTKHREGGRSHLKTAHCLWSTWTQAGQQTWTHSAGRQEQGITRVTGSRPQCLGGRQHLTCYGWAQSSHKLREPALWNLGKENWENAWNWKLLWET